MRTIAIALGLIGLIASGALAPMYAQAQTTPASAVAPPVPPEDPPMVPAAGPGVFSMQKKGDALHLVVAGHKFSSRGEIERYLAYRAAEQTLAQKANWFTFEEMRGKGETADPAPRTNPRGFSYSFQMKYFRPVWRYKTSASPEWKSWSPFTGVAFIANDPKTITDFEVSADIVLRKGTMDDTNPLAFEPAALSDFLVNQVSPPQ